MDRKKKMHQAEEVAYTNLLNQGKREHKEFKAPKVVQSDQGLEQKAGDGKRLG